MSMSKVVVGAPCKTAAAMPTTMNSTCSSSSTRSISSKLAPGIALIHVADSENGVGESLHFAEALGWSELQERSNLTPIDPLVVNRLTLNAVTVNATRMVH